MIDYINTNVDHHIITIEDPIEFYHYHKKSTVNQREVGVDVPSFSEALRRALRQDPDVILVGELRDLATIEAAITAAETGHVVFGTLHTTGAQGTVNRIIDVFPTNQQEQIRTQLSTAIIGILVAGPVAQDRRRPRGLLRTAGRHAGHRQPDSRKQDLPHQLRDSNRPQAGHATAGRSPVQAVAGRQGHGGGCSGQSPDRRGIAETHRQRNNGASSKTRRISNGGHKCNSKKARDTSTSKQWAISGTVM